MQCLNGHPYCPGVLVKAAKGRQGARTQSRLRGAPCLSSVLTLVWLGENVGCFIFRLPVRHPLYQLATQFPHGNYTDEFEFVWFEKLFLFNSTFEGERGQAFPKLPVNYPVLRLAPTGEGKHLYREWSVRAPHTHTSPQEALSNLKAVLARIDTREGDCLPTQLPCLQCLGICLLQDSLYGSISPISPCCNTVLSRSLGLAWMNVHFSVNFDCLQLPVPGSIYFPFQAPSDLTQMLGRQMLHNIPSLVLCVPFFFSI